VEGHAAVSTFNMQMKRKDGVGTMARVTHAPPSTKICSSCRLKAWALLLPIGDSNLISNELPLIPIMKEGRRHGKRMARQGR